MKNTDVILIGVVGVTSFLAVEAGIVVMLLRDIKANGLLVTLPGIPPIPVKGGLGGAVSLSEDATKLRDNMHMIAGGVALGTVVVASVVLLAGGK